MPQNSLTIFFINKFLKKLIIPALILINLFFISSLSYANDDSFKKDVELAKMGNPGANFRLGTRYLNGIQVAVDYDKALYFLTQAAEKDHANAIYSIGYMYLYGEGVKVNHKKAFKLIQRSALLDFPPAYYLLGLMYYDGIGVRKSERKAYFNVKAAFDKGYESKNIFLDHDKKTLIIAR